MGNTRLTRLKFPSPLERIVSGLFLSVILALWAVLASPFLLAKGLRSLTAAD